MICKYYTPNGVVVVVPVIMVILPQEAVSAEIKYLVLFTIISLQK